MLKEELLAKVQALPDGLDVKLWNVTEAANGGYGSGEYDITDIDVEDQYEGEDGPVVGQGIVICFESE